MNPCKPHSNLDGSAPEFIPRSEQAKVDALAKLKEMVEPIFESGKSFDSQLIQLEKVAMVDSVNGSCLVGEVLANASTTTQRRSNVGFRFFMKLRSQLSNAYAENLEFGLLNQLHMIATQIVTDNTLEIIFSHNESPPSLCEESGDVPLKHCHPELDRVLGVLQMLHLSITRLNLLEDSTESICIPPALPCTDLCQLMISVCRLQLTYNRARGPDESDERYGPIVIFDQQDWVAFLYKLFDSFSQCVLFINYFMASISSGVLSGTWGQTSENGQYEICSQISYALDSVLEVIRELLLDERLPLKLLRSTALDILLLVNRLASSRQAVAQNWSESFDGSLGSELRQSEDEVQQSYEKFLIETNQINNV